LWGNKGEEEGGGVSKGRYEGGKRECREQVNDEGEARGGEGRSRYRVDGKVVEGRGEGEKDKWREDGEKGGSDEGKTR